MGKVVFDTGRLAYTAMVSKPLFSRGRRPDCLSFGTNGTSRLVHRCPPPTNGAAGLFVRNPSALDRRLQGVAPDGHADHSVTLGAARIRHIRKPATTIRMGKAAPRMCQNWRSATLLGDRVLNQFQK